MTGLVVKADEKAKHPVKALAKIEGGGVSGSLVLM